MNGDAFLLKKAPKECSKKLAADLRGRSLKRRNDLRIFRLFLERFLAPLQGRCRHSSCHETSCVSGFVPKPWFRRFPFCFRFLLAWGKCFQQFRFLVPLWFLPVLSEHIYFYVFICIERIRASQTLTIVYWQASAPPKKASGDGLLGKCHGATHVSVRQAILFLCFQIGNGFYGSPPSRNHVAPCQGVFRFR